MTIAQCVCLFFAIDSSFVLGKTADGDPIKVFSRFVMLTIALLGAFL